MPTRLIVADDHPVALRGLTSLVLSDPDLEVVATCADGDELFQSVMQHRPCVVVSDLNMPGRRVLDLLPDLRDAVPETRVVILTMSREPGDAVRAFAAGATGYVLKDDSDADLLHAISAAARGERFVNPSFAARVAADESAMRPGGLSPRQIEILRLLALGHTNAQISARLGLSLRTIESHRAQILAKLDARERYELVEFALHHRLIGAAA
ncbi:MAG TPA: response regulator transcription factor [Solirubrobacteraceae bacterium]|nr:response regulator transcription factor [Solirubrobacteraceae bacterium]